MGTLRAIIDDNGRVLGAQFDPAREDDDKDETPSAELIPMAGQHVIHVDVPDEIARLSAPDLSRFFSHLEVSWPATVRVPRLEVRQAHDQE